MGLDLVSAAPADGRLPVVMWHGMGDTCCSPFSMDPIKKHIEQETGAYVTSIRVGNSTGEDEIAGFFGNFYDQLDTVCAQLKADPKLAGGFNAVGFSQGGQFLRAYAQRCNDPPVHNLVSMGGQHMGVAEIPHCLATNQTLCELMAKFLSVGAYVDGIREYQIQAQYFRSPYDYATYVARNVFLADLNNEREQKNATYKANLLKLNKLALIKFTEDTMVIPRESEWFGAFKEGAEAEIVPMEQQPLYKEDWIGLQQLNKTNRLDLLACPGDHLQFTLEWFKTNIINRYFM